MDYQTLQQASAQMPRPEGSNSRYHCLSAQFCPDKPGASGRKGLQGSWNWSRERQACYSTQGWKWSAYLAFSRFFCTAQHIFRAFIWISNPDFTDIASLMGKDTTVSALKSEVGERIKAIGNHQIRMRAAGQDPSKINIPDFDGRKGRQG